MEIIRSGEATHARHVLGWVSLDSGVSRPAQDRIRQGQARHIAGLRIAAAEMLVRWACGGAIGRLAAWLMSGDGGK